MGKAKLVFVGEPEKEPVIAIIDDGAKSEEDLIRVGIWYNNTGLSWTTFNQVREIRTFDEWRDMIMDHLGVKTLYNG